MEYPVSGFLRPVRSICEGEQFHPEGAGCGLIPRHRVPFINEHDGRLHEFLVIVPSGSEIAGQTADAVNFIGIPLIGSIESDERVWTQWTNNVDLAGGRGQRNRPLGYRDFPGYELRDLRERLTGS